MKSLDQYKPKFVYLAGTEKRTALLAPIRQAVLDFPLAGYFTLDELQTAYNKAVHLSNDYFNILAIAESNMGPAEDKPKQSPQQYQLDLDF